MTNAILKLLQNLESEHGIEILYACESESRAWGFASPDSDFDIRFIFRRPRPEALSIELLPETIECPISDDLDPAGWELRKSLRLLRKSNGPLSEWLHSPIVYRTDQVFLDEMRQLLRSHLSCKALAGHYRGLASRIHQSRLEDQAPSAKAYLYCLRAILAARHILDTQSPPPVPFRELLDHAPTEILPAIHQLLDWKARANENDSPGALPSIEIYIGDSLPLLKQEIDVLTENQPPTTPFDKVLCRWYGWARRLSSRSFCKSDFTLDRILQPDLLLFECVAGSRAFGTQHAGSDHDLRGIFVAPPAFLCGMESIEQVSDSKSDEVYYELGRFISLLAANNPNLIELLYTPANCIRFKHPAFDMIRPEIFLSKLCSQTFGNYAMSQIRKARGLNKKIVNPEPEERRHLREFCHIIEGQGSIPLTRWLESNGIPEDECGLVATRHAPDLYGLFHSSHTEPNYRGVFSKKDQPCLLYSSVAKEAVPVAWMHCNLDAFKAHCKSHREYWQWVAERNENRYLTNSAHGRGYDSKNLMHTLRLLEQAIEIARDQCITMPRPNANWLKQVKMGNYEYEELLQIADDKHREMQSAFDRSSLPDTPSREAVSQLLLRLRDAF